MRMIEAKNGHLIMVGSCNREIKRITTLDEAFEVAKEWCKESSIIDGDYWMYKGGSHIALMIRDPFDNSSERIGMWSE